MLLRFTQLNRIHKMVIQLPMFAYMAGRITLKSEAIEHHVLIRREDVLLIIAYIAI